MGPSGSQALRNDFRSHFDDELISKQTEELAMREEERKAEVRELSGIAMLKDHPGWEKLMESWTVKIANYRSGAFLGEFLNDASVSNETIGQMARAGNWVADEMQQLINAVNLADEVVEEERANARQRARSKRTD